MTRAANATSRQRDAGSSRIRARSILERPVSETEPYKKWMCVVCGWIYDEEKGDPDSGLPPGTRWDDVPESWVCPDCAAGKEDFEMVEF